MLLCMSILTPIIAQDSFSEEKITPTFAVNGSLGFFSNQIDDFTVNLQPLLTGSCFFKINGHLYAGIGAGFGTWIYSNNDGATNIKDNNFTIPIFATARYKYAIDENPNIFFDVKIGYRFGKKVTLDMLSENRTGQDERIIKGNGLFSSLMLGISVKKLEFGIGFMMQTISYDKIEHTVVKDYNKITDFEGKYTTLMHSFFVQVGYWF